MGKVKLSPEDIDKLVEPEGLINKMKNVLISDSSAPLRPSLEEKGSWFSSMTARGLGYYVVKLVGVYPKNLERGLPLVRGLVLLFDAERGDLLLEADAERFTAIRTAAATALALKVMKAHGGILGIIGAGTQGTAHATFLSKIMRFERYFIYDYDTKRAERLAKELGGEVANLRDLLTNSDVIVSATTSRKPVILGKLVKRGTRIASIGAPKPVKEADLDTLKRAHCILVDTKEGVLNEAGCFEDVAKSGTDLELVELREVLRGIKDCVPKEIWFYKSVGTALFDLATAIYLYEKALETF